jgi:hypothetical protein
MRPQSKEENNVTKKLLAVVLGLFGAASAFGQSNDFLSNYSLLDDAEADVLDQIYLVPNAEQRLADYKAILVDQPEIFIAADSKYKGAKGDQLKLLADTARLATIERLEASGFAIADEPGPDVLYMRWAITDMYLKKKKRGILSYTPVGMVVHATKSAAIRDLWKKIDIVELSLEVELSDLVTGEILGAAVTAQQGLRKSKGQKADIVSWQELDALFTTVGERLSCRLTNARGPENEARDCTGIWIEPEVPAKK